MTHPNWDWDEPNSPTLEELLERETDPVERLKLQQRILERDE